MQKPTADTTLKTAWRPQPTSKGFAAADDILYNSQSHGGSRRDTSQCAVENSFFRTLYNNVSDDVDVHYFMCLQTENMYSQAVS